MNKLPIPLLSLGLAVGLSAQDTSAVLKLVPRDAVFVMQMDAPSEWAGKFAPTRLGQFLSSSTVHDLLQPLSKDIEDELAELRSEADSGVADLLEALAGFDGRVTMAVGVEPIAGAETPQLRALFAMSPRSGDDLARLEESLVRVMEERANEAGEPIVEHPFGDHTLRVVQPDDSDEPLWGSMPTRIGDDLVILLWNGGPDRIDAWSQLAAEQQFVAPANFQNSLAIQVRLGGLIDELLEQSDSGTFDLRAILEALGLAGLRSFDMSIDARGAFAETEFGLEWDGHGGLLDAFVPERSGPPRLLELTPKHAPVWSVSPFRLDVFYDALAATWDAVGDIVPMTREDAEASFEEMFKVRLREDLIDRFGGEMMTVADVSTFDDEDVDDPLKAFSGQSYAFELKDAHAFGESLERLLRARGLQASRKTSDYRGIKLYQLRLAGLLTIDYAITDRLLVVAFNSRETTHLRAILDEELARRAGEPPSPMPEDVAERIATFGADWTSLSVTDANMFFEAFRAGFTGALQDPDLGDLPVEDLKDLLETTHRLQSAMMDAGLDKMVGASWSKPGRIRTRIVW